MAHSPEVLRAIESMAREGKSDPEIAEALEIPRHGVRSVRRRLGINGAGTSPGTTGQDRFDWSHVDWSQTNAAIATQLACHHTAVAQRRKKRRGGKRPGAGRKPRPEARKVPMTIKIDRELAKYLETVDGKTAAIEVALRRSKGFRAWKKLNG